jgi:putative chitinase
MPVLKQGSTGPEVTALQIQLKTLGFDPKGTDGNFGPGTKAALIAFQKSKGLQPDGAAGPLTMVALGLSVAGTNTTQPSSATTNATATPVTSDVVLNAPGLNLAGLTGHLPTAVIAQIPETAAKFGIKSNLRLAHFLAQCALESNRFKATVENLNYSGQRLLKVFPKYFRGVDPAGYANNSVKIGNRVYANRMGNGDEASGDGYRFRGRGYIQLTGKNNYTSFSKFIGEDCVANPDLVATTYPLASAAFFFNSNNIWPVCDQGSSDATVRAVSIRVNGQNPHAVPERTAFFKEFFGALT